MNNPPGVRIVESNLESSMGLLAGYLGFETTLDLKEDLDSSPHRQGSRCGFHRKQGGGFHDITSVSYICSAKSKQHKKSRGSDSAQCWRTRAKKTRERVDEILAMLSTQEESGFCGAVG